MQRRARIKAVANLSNVRRSTSKNNTENSQENVISKKDVKDQLNEIQEKISSENEQIIEDAVKQEAIDQETLSNSVDKVDDVNKCNNLLDKLDEKSSCSDNSDKPVTQDDNSINKEVEIDIQIPQESFKDPVKATPRAENASTSSKFRKPKIAPRLNIARAVSKVQEVVDEKPKQNDVIVEVSSPILSPIHAEKEPELPVNIFSPPSTPFSPPPNRQRPETPREILDSPGLIINHNLHHPPTPQSPFYPTPHSRIRTESLCSIKSTTVANLQPRKKVRTEDQKILDNKRESRERLSNKQIEKSQLRMFDMIYYNPTTNPMKPRAPPPTTKEKSPKKIDLTMELPPSPKEPSNAIAVPQLKLNADGELVLDEASLVVENEEQKKNRILLANTNVVYHDELSGTYGYYKRQQRTKEWPQEETIKFYRCLNTVGTDFSLMLNLFPNRSRRDLKLKFKKEEKNNPNLVDKALLNHNTFDIEELQRELDEEDEIRRKEAESKSSEVKELVKRKILKKQEAKAKARQQDKAKIEKILSDGDLVLNSVDNPTQELKENMEKSEAAGKRKRAPKRKNIKPEPSMEFKKIILHAKINESISVHELKSQESVSESPIIFKEPPEQKAAIVYKEVTSSYESNITENNSIKSMQPETSTLSIIAKTEKESSTIIDNLISDMPNDAQMDEINQDTMLSKTGRFISDLITDSYHDTQENDYLMEEEVDIYDCHVETVKKEEPSQKNAVEESSLETIPTNETEFAIIDIQPSTSSIESTEMAGIDEQQTDSSEMSTETVIERPILISEPSYNPSIIPVESSSVISLESSYEQSEVSAMMSTKPSISEEQSYPSTSSEIYYEQLSFTPDDLTSKPSYSSSVISMEPSISSAGISSLTTEPSYSLSSMSTEQSSMSLLSAQDTNNPKLSAEFTNNSIICMEPEPETICIADTEPTAEEPIDDETFLNSLDLERLVIVVKQVNGKDFYDIHETDGDMQNLSDQPLNLPRHIVDLIVDAMTQDD